MQPKDFVLHFVKKEQVAADTYTFYFDRTNVPDFTFIAGQYLKWTLPHDHPDERGTSRLFTISSSSLNTSFITLTTKIIQSTFKKALFALPSGAEMQCYGPMGRFIYDTSIVKPAVFLAGGIGLTPFHSILTSLVDAKLAQPIYFFVSFSTVEEVIFYDELMAVAQKNPQIHVIYTITHSDENPSTSSRKKEWTGQTGRVSKEMIEKYVGIGLDKNIYYLCGPKAMVDAMESTLKESGITQDLIKKENFVGY